MKNFYSFFFTLSRIRILVSFMFAILGLKIKAQVSSSDIPIIVINTNSQQILDDPKIMADMGIIYNGIGIRNYLTDSFNNYNGKIGIELRGASSQQYYPKKSYGIELWDNAGIPKDTNLLGMPPESDWCLIANYIDKSLINNSLTYTMWQEMGWWGSRHQSVELYLNGNYEGVYLLVEKIKRDSNRVDISKLLSVDTTGDQLTGGYILTIDQQAGNSNYSWTSQYEAYGVFGNGVYPNFICTYPGNNNMPIQQKNYITQYVDSFETAIITNQFDPFTGWQKYADINSFVDYFLIQEFSRNVDGYRASTYFYKDKDSKGGKLTMGLVWDYDRGWGNASYAFGNYPAGWDWPFGDNYTTANPLQVPEWWNHLLMDSSFTKALRCRWEQLKFTTLSVAHLHQYCDSMAIYLNESQQRNFVEWPILGVQIFPNPLPVPTTYAGEIIELKNWISSRWIWLDANIPGNAVNCNFVSVQERNNPKINFTVYPNPTDNSINLKWEKSITGNMNIGVFDVSGRELKSIDFNFLTNEQTITIDVGEFSQGLYFIRAKTIDDEFVKMFVKR